VTSDEVRRFQKAQPFQPFDIHLADGRVIHVPHHDFVYVPPINHRTVVVTDSQGVPEHINILDVVSICPSTSAGKEPRKRRKAG
jgi:hypothetical protein